MKKVGTKGPEETFGAFCIVDKNKKASIIKDYGC